MSGEEEVIDIAARVDAAIQASNAAEGIEDGGKEDNDAQVQGDDGGTDASAVADDGSAGGDSQETTVETGGGSEDPTHGKVQTRVAQDAKTILGLSDEDIAAEDPAILERLVQIETRRIAALGRQVKNPSSDADQSTNSGKTPQAPAGKGNADIADIDPDEYGEPLAKMTKAMQERLAAQEKQLADMRLEKFHNEVDASFRDLPEELFGKGNIDSVEEKFQQNRKKAFETAETLLLGMKARGIAPPPLKDLIAKAYQMEFADHIKSKASAVTAQRLSDYGKGKLNRTSSGNRSKVSTKYEPGSTEAILNDPDFLAFKEKINDE